MNLPSLSDNISYYYHIKELESKVTSLQCWIIILCFFVLVLLGWLFSLQSSISEIVSFFEENRDRLEYLSDYIDKLEQVFTYLFGS